MHNLVTLTLMPAGTTCKVPAGTPLRDILGNYGVEFPCGGRLGACMSCRVKLLKGDLPATPSPSYRLTPQDIEEGWRLACKHQADTDLHLHVEQWDSPVLTDDTTFAFTPSTGLGIAIDLGTTTLAAQLLDLKTGHVIGVKTAQNPQRSYGADLMSRISYATAEHGQERLQTLIRDALLELILILLKTHSTRQDELTRITIVGNAPMHHLFAGIDVTPFAAYPFEGETTSSTFTPDQLNWPLPPSVTIQVLPDLGSFVGSDILAGILATDMHHSDQLNILVDLGTNGEIVIGNRHRMICASTAAGPAFEAANISCGMQATHGAISHISVHQGAPLCTVIGNSTARGICGSGLVDAAAVALDLGLITSAGKLNQPTMSLAPKVDLNQADFRELQLAKAAISAGIRILLQQLGKTPDDVAHVYLAGAFGNYIQLTSAQRIGLLPYPLDRIVPIGNAALHGAKLALFMDDTALHQLETLHQQIEHICLSADPTFQDIYVDELFF